MKRSDFLKSILALPAVVTAVAKATPAAAPNPLDKFDWKIDKFKPDLIYMGHTPYTDDFPSQRYRRFDVHDLAKRPMQPLKPFDDWK